MLVLTRKQQQQIQVGEGVTITILRIKGGSVRIGIEAPSDVRIVRSELTPHQAEEGPTQTEESLPSRSESDHSLMSEVSDEECEGYKVLSFRVPGESQETSHNRGPESMSTNSRIQSMRDFMALRSTHSLD
jgi:carbon storage regulator CsrA